jgi:phosphoglycolate phosphatase
MSRLRNIVFDLDGTLIDSVPVFVEILNAMLCERGSARRVGPAETRRFASMGGPALVGGILAQDCGDLQQEVDDFRSRYMACPTPVSSLYEGVAEGIKDLAGHGFRLAICSNKPQLLCEKVISDLGFEALFPVVVGSAPDRLAKPAPDLMELVIAQLGASREECLYVGDSEIDQTLARVTGVRFAFVTYGYASEQYVAGQHEEFSRFPDLVESVKAESRSFMSARGAA